MMFTLVLIAIVSAVSALGSWMADNLDCLALWGLVFVASAGFAYHKSTQPEYIAERAAEAREAAAQEARERVPHVIREADGCKVYAWKGGDRYHYFTRCPAQTTTEGHYEHCTGSGKQRHCEDRSESIVTSTK